MAWGLADPSYKGRNCYNPEGKFWKRLIIVYLFMNLGKLIGILVVLGLPFGILEGMWSEPSLRNFARSLNGSKSMWISFGIYYAIVFSTLFLKKRNNEVKRK